MTWGPLTVMNGFGKDSNSGRPNSDRQKWDDHFWHDAAVHSHHDGPLGMFFHVPGAMLDKE